MDLSDEEKLFVAHFLLGSQSYVKPVFRKYISLYSYLDQTDESIAIQEKQIKEDDWYFTSLLEKIYKQSNETTWNKVFEELDREGFFENENFYNKFLAVATWLYSKNSLRYVFEAQKEAQRISAQLERLKQINEDREKAKRDEWRHVSLPVSDKSTEELNQDRINAMKLLYKGGGTSKGGDSNRKPADDWGLKLRPKLLDDGNDWREQS